MGITLRVYCRSKNPLTRSQIANWVDEVAVLGAEPRFVPAPDDPESGEPDWDFMEIVHAPRKRPILVHRIGDTAAVGESVGETVDWMERYAPGEPPPHLVERVRASQQVFVFELSANLSEEAWELVDVAQSYIARELDGVVAAEDGIYDADLQPLLKYSAG